MFPPEIDVVRAGLLQPPFVFRIEAAAIADENRGHDPCRARAPSTDRGPGHLAHMATEGSSGLFEIRPSGDERDDRGALHRSDERDALSCQPAAFARHAGVLVVERFPKRGV